MKSKIYVSLTALSLLVIATATARINSNIGVGAKAPAESEVIIDGTRATLDAKWIYWEGPGFKSAMPIQ